MRRQTRTIAVVLALAAANPARAGELATAFKAGQLSRTEILAAGDGSDRDAEDMTALCRLRLFDNENAAASACFQNLLAADPTNKRVLAGAAEAAQRLGAYASAAAWYEKLGRPAQAEQSRILSATGAYTARTHRRRYVASFEKADPLPVLMVRLADQRTHPFVLDTGAAQTIIDPQLAAKLGVVPLSGTSVGVFAGGQTARVGAAMLSSFALGDLELENIPVQLLSTAGFAAALDGTVVEGVIGVDILRRFQATIDYPRRRLVLTPPERAQPARGPTMRFWLAGDHLLLAEAKIDDVSELALLDTGLAGSGCTAPQSTMDAVGQVATGPGDVGIGGGGPTSAVAFKAKSITLGPIVEANVDCLLGPFPPSLETSSGVRIGLLVSHAFLKRFAVTFDFLRMRLTLGQ